MQPSTLAIFVFLIAALLEVAGDAVIRVGLRGGGFMVIVIGFSMLGTYGVVVNLLGWDFSRLFGVYVAVFATVAVLVGRLVFHEAVPASTWTGLAVVVVGGLIIQFGPLFAK